MNKPRLRQVDLLGDKVWICRGSRPRRADRCSFGPPDYWEPGAFLADRPIDAYKEFVIWYNEPLDGGSICHHQ